MAVEERRSELRLALVAAAGTAIDDAGLAGIKARRLAEAAGCALGAIYNVFPDLDALILEVNSRTLEAAGQAIAGGAVADEPEARLQKMALAYLDFAAGAKNRWRALFEHRMTDGRPVPSWYREVQQKLFEQVEAPIGRLRPDIGEAERAELARTLFSAVHGVVSLGLEEKLGTLPMKMLRRQVADLVSAVVAGLARTAQPAPLAGASR